MNIEALRHVTDGDRALEEKFVRMFLNMLENCLERLPTLVSVDPKNDWQKIIHELKGAALNIHADSMANICKSAEFLSPGDAARAIALEKIKAEYMCFKSALSQTPQ